MIRPFGATTVADRLAELHEQGRLRYLGVADRGGPLTVEVGSRRRELPAAEMVAWLQGWLAGQGAQLVAAPRPEPLVAAKRILVHPTYEDQLRLRVRWNMDRAGISLTELARRMGVTKKTVHEALRFGRPGGYLAIFVPFDDEPRIRHDLAEADPGTPVTVRPPDGWPEPREVLRLRLLAYAHQAGVVDWIGPLGVAEATSMAHGVTFEIGVGAQVHKVGASTLPDWLLGVADVLHPPVADDVLAARKVDGFTETV